MFHEHKMVVPTQYFIFEVISMLIQLIYSGFSAFGMLAHECRMKKVPFF